MRALTVKQPWASLIASGLKQIENRTYPVPKTVRGERIAIHAGKGFDSEWRNKYPCTCGDRGAVTPEFVKSESCEPCRFARDFLSYDQTNLIFYPGRILCTARIVGQIHPDEEFYGRTLSTVTEFVYNRHLDVDRTFYQTGAYGWILADVELVNDPRIHRGMLGFWEVPDV